jgi:hypothetical protein
MSSRKVRAVRRRVSFSVPDEIKDDVLIERTGVHAPLKVSAVEEPSLDIDSKSAPMRDDIDGEVSASSSGSSESGSDQSGSGEISSDGNDEMVQEDDVSDALAPKAHRGTALEKVRADKGTDVSSLSAPTTCELRQACLVGCCQARMAPSNACPGCCHSCRSCRSRCSGGGSNRVW